MLLALGIGSLLFVATLYVAHADSALNSNRSLLEVSSSSSSSSSYSSSGSKVSSSSSSSSSSSGSRSSSSSSSNSNSGSKSSSSSGPITGGNGFNDKNQDNGYWDGYQDRDGKGKHGNQPGKNNNGNGNTGSSNSGSSNTGVSTNTGSSNTGSSTSGSSNPSGSNSGSTNTGSSNAGSSNTGSTNPGSSSTGTSNTGSSNTGSSNTGSTNTGSTNTGSTNIGSSSTGTSNTGSSNTGSSNTGSSNTGSSNTGSTTTGSSAGSVLTYTPNQQCTNGKTAYLTGLTDVQKAELLKAHNDFRSTIAMGKAPGQPGATDMLEMVWDDEVAAKAQAWADHCEFDHDTDAGMQTSKFQFVGQNLDLYQSSKKLSTISLTDMVKDLYDEVNLYNGKSAPVDKYVYDDGTGHYTQIAWAKSYALGCGFKVYQDDGMYTYQLTCNYGPGGNWDGDKIYTKGTFNASNCKNGASTTYSGLCKA